MSSFLSDSQKDSLGNQFFKLHDTFARPITIWKNAQQTVISSNPSNNYLFEKAPFNDTTQKVLVSGTFMARILYDKYELLTQFNGTSASAGSANQVNLKRENGGVRIQVDITGANYLFDAQTVTFDGEIFDISSTERPHGLFPPKFYSFYLNKLN